MITYPKIETLFDRVRDVFEIDHESPSYRLPANFLVVPGQFRLPEFGLINYWTVTEKIHGTNIRVILNPHAPRFPNHPVILGRSDAAQVPRPLHDMLMELFTPERVAAVREGADENSVVTLFGEGYGPKIQAQGGSYRSTPGFRLFDVHVQTYEWVEPGAIGPDFAAHYQPAKGWWLNWETVEEISESAQIPLVPVLGHGLTTEEAASLVCEFSTVARLENDLPDWVQEGIVARTEPLLFDRVGRRVMWKLKGADLGHSN